MLFAVPAVKKVKYGTSGRVAQHGRATMKEMKSASGALVKEGARKMGDDTGKIEKKKRGFNRRTRIYRGRRETTHPNTDAPYITTSLTAVHGISNR